MGFSLMSESFLEGESIPQECSCEGVNISPALHWSGAPKGTKSFVLIVNDPDAPVGDWIHWVIYDIPVSVNTLREGVVADPVLADGSKQGMNDFGKIGYGGPCPPRGKPHRYFFTLYALDAKIALDSGATKGDVEAAIKGHVLEKTTLMGTYQRK